MKLTDICRLSDTQKLNLCHQLGLEVENNTFDMTVALNKYYLSQKKEIVITLETVSLIFDNGQYYIINNETQQPYTGLVFTDKDQALNFVYSINDHHLELLEIQKTNERNVLIADMNSKLESWEDYWECDVVIYLD